METELPVSAVLPAIRSALSQADELVLEAPPGAGKTTLVPLALLDEDWLAGRSILMLQPRRLAARACAEYMAGKLGEKVGETVGYRVRLDSRVGKATRIEVVTEGILTRRLQSDPSLEGVGLLIFDEFHERSLDADLGLALALQGRELFRGDADALKILVMSATLDGKAVAELLTDAPVVSCEGRQYPVDVHYGASRRLADSVIEPCVALLHELVNQQDSGSILVFLPGQGEIRRVARELQVPADVVLCPLYGGLSLQEQRRAIAPIEGGQRKLVLATNIAETSLTIEGIRTVVDSGLARVPQYDAATGMSRLHTRRISRASSVQRMGRAGRLGPGQCFRLWSEEQQQQLAPQGEAEIKQADLASLALQLLSWGIDDPLELRWLDTPPEGAWAQALEVLQVLQVLGATQLGEQGNWLLTEEGEQMAALPVHPRLAAMLIHSAQWGVPQQGAALAALFTERDPLSGSDCNMARRLALLDDSTSVPNHLRGWRDRTRRQAQAYLKQVQKQVQKQLKSLANKKAVDLDMETVTGVLLATAWPDRIAQRQQEGVYLLSNGRRARLPGSDGLSREPWLVAADIGGRAGQAEDRIYLAATLPEAAIESYLADYIEQHELLEWDERSDRLLALSQGRLGHIVLSSTPATGFSPEQRALAVAQLIGRRGLELLPWTDELRQWQARVCLVQSLEGGQWPDLSDSWLLAHLDSWLAPYLQEITSLAKLRNLDLAGILSAQLTWPLPRELDALAPQRLRVPSGSEIKLDYCQAPPVLAVKLQEMFQCQDTPKLVNGKQAVLVHLLSPAGRPLQVTQDLAGFWRSSYQEIKKEMKGRYPKHPWPDDPLAAAATRHTKKRQQREDR